MQDLGHVKLHATLHGAEQLEVDDGLAVLQKTRVNTGYSGHTLTLTLPAPMNELNELLTSEGHILQHDSSSAASLIVTYQQTTLNVMESCTWLL